MEEVEPGQGAASGGSSTTCPTIMWQRRHWVIWPFVAITLAAAIAAFALPTLYRSTASLLVQSQDLPTSVVQAPTAGDIEQRIARIRERVLSRGDLIRLIEQNNLTPKSGRSSRFPRSSRRCARRPPSVRRPTILAAPQAGCRHDRDRHQLRLLRSRSGAGRSAKLRQRLPGAGQ
jgi:hypothetical protein